MGGTEDTCPVCGQPIRGAGRLCGGGHCAEERRVMEARRRAGVKHERAGRVAAAKRRERTMARKRGR